LWTGAAKDLFALNANLARCFDADFDSVPLNMDDGNNNLIADYQSFAFLAT
jgi:hypothetical protein